MKKFKTKKLEEKKKLFFVCVYVKTRVNKKEKEKETEKITTLNFKNA